MSECKRCGITGYEHYVGVATHCKPCWRQHVLEYRAANLAKVQAYDRERGLLEHRKESVRRLAPKYKHKRAASSAANNAKHPEKRAARIAAGNAIREGRLIPAPCVRCGASKTHAHHEDYSRPMDVVWLCVHHHGERHREINEGRRPPR